MGSSARDRLRVGMRALPLAAAVLALGVLAAPAKADLVARGIEDGMLALGPAGTPHVAYIRGTRLVIADRVSKERWRDRNAGSVARGSKVMAFSVGAKGPVALVQAADDRTLVLIRHRGTSWQRVQLAGRLPTGSALGWPGLALGPQGLPVVAYARWTGATQNSQLVLARVDARGKFRSERITAAGFPQSYVPPPAAPVLVGGRVHIIEAFGYRGLVGLLEWRPEGKTWTGLHLDAALGEFPIGPVVARASVSGTLYAAASLSMIGAGFLPVSLVAHARGADPTADFVDERALATALAVPTSGPEIAANTWVADDPLDLTATDFIYAGTVIAGTTRVELDGWLAGFAAAPRGARDILLARPDGLSWFRSPGALRTSVTLAARRRPDGSVSLSGRIADVQAGTVAIYREGNGGTRQLVARADLSGGSFSLTDASPAEPFVYRAVYTDAATGIPYGALVRERIVRGFDDDG